MNGGRLVLVQDVSGSGVLVPYSLRDDCPPEEFNGVIHKLADDLSWLGDNLAAMRVYDVLRALDMIEEFPGADAADIRIYAHGRQGIYGRLQPFWIDAFAACKSWMASRVIASWSVRVTTTPMTSRVCFCAECFNTSISPRSKVLESPIGLLDQSVWNGPAAVSVGRTVWTGRAVQGFKLTRPSCGAAAYIAHDGRARRATGA